MINFRQILEQKKGRLLQIEQQLDSASANLELLQHEQINLEKAQIVIQTVEQLKQEQLKYHISELVTLALAAVFDDPYEFEVDFQRRRNQTECDLWFVRDGQRLDPLSSSGVGCVDVAAFALRVSLWSLKRPHTRPILVLDEPFKHIKGEDDNIKAIQMVKEVSDKMGLQIIMVSDERIPLHEIEAGADRVFSFALKKRVSKVSVL